MIINKNKGLQEVIRAILSLFNFFFTGRFHTHTHTQEAQNAYKQIKTKKTAFFMHLKNI